MLKKDIRTALAKVKGTPKWQYDFSGYPGLILQADLSHKGRFTKTVYRIMLNGQKVGMAATSSQPETARVEILFNAVQAATATI